MNTRVGGPLSGAGSASVGLAARPWGAPAVARGIGLSAKLADGVFGLLRPGWTQPCRDGIAVSPMSGEWLQECAAVSGRHGDSY
ncbi:MAG TPA: hypothetical protein VD833_17065 [Vicinamibacterales bacterium]|nr:hypothetical protein [Vicinamibacterales bacterium]